MVPRSLHQVGRWGYFPFSVCRLGGFIGRLLGNRLPGSIFLKIRASWGRVGNQNV